MAEEQAPRQKSVRVWTAIDPEDLKQHTLYVDDLYGFCSNCRQMNLNYTKDRSCPGCGTTFKYLATKLKAPGDVGKILARLKKESLTLKLIDRDDLEKASAQDQLNKLFG
ncbi:MAG: hypothetical protein H7A21_01990 [Spirochaetales bacterium]|nr:hypothetical protein [Leptospiraceae bacterium]MCP5480177.1 hypothetical protein [Spirochaetales bacterium]MCP5485483.1 hypothetical protein [Spirochaetales bacterium]